jgi:CheY-like chemotaxis protein
MKALGNILVVDDNSDWRSELEAVLSKDGFSVLTAADREEALSILLEQPLHVAVLDLKLDTGDLSKDEGFVLLEEIHRMGLSGMIYSIMLTGYATSAYTRDAFAKYNVTDFFEKGTFNSRVEEFRQAVKRAVLKAKYAQLSKLGFRCFKTGGRCSHTIIEDPNYIFVAMPYRSEQNNLYEYGLRPLQSTLECEIERADEKLMTVDLMCKICQLIQKASICVVDITTWNANVMFELGLMYGWGKPVILIKRRGEKTEKANLKGMEFISYDMDDYPALQDSLTAILRAAGIDTRQVRPPEKIGRIAQATLLCEIGVSTAGSEPDAGTIAEVRELVSQDQLEQALKTLSNIEVYKRDGAQLSRRLARIRRQNRQGTMTRDDTDAEYARIANAILDLISS